MAILLGFFIGLALCATVGISLLLRFIQDLRQERTALTDRLLIRQGHSALSAPLPEPARIIQSTPDQDFNSFLTDAYKADEIKEEAERIQPNLRSLTLEDIQENYPGIYNQAYQAYMARQHLLTN